MGALRERDRYSNPIKPVIFLHGHIFNDANSPDLSLNAFSKMQNEMEDDGFVNAAIEVFGQQAVVVDRYHVAKLYRKPLDQLRIKEMKRLKEELALAMLIKLPG